MIQSIFFQLTRLQQGKLTSTEIEELKLRMSKRVDEGKLPTSFYFEILEFINHYEDPKDE